MWSQALPKKYDHQLCLNTFLGRTLIGMISDWVNNNMMVLLVYNNCVIEQSTVGAGVTTDVIQRDSASVVSGSHHRHLLESLMKLHCAPTDLLITTVSDKPLFSTHWRELAKHLDLSDAEIERCEARGIRDEAENCLQMLTLWRNTRAGAATVAVLADAVYNKCRNMNMLEILHGACESCAPVV